MKMEELVESLTYLGLAYNKEYSQSECKVYYDFLGKYNSLTLNNAIRNIIMESEYVPKISKLIKACEEEKENQRYAILNFMNEYGYFKNHAAYSKAKLSLDNNDINDDLKKDMNEYYRMMANPNMKLLENKKAEKERREEEEKQALIEQINKLRESIG